MVIRIAYEILVETHIFFSITRKFQNQDFGHIGITLFNELASGAGTAQHLTQFWTY